MLAYQIELVVFFSIILIIALSNLSVLRRLGQFPAPAHFPSVSILLPVRNEAENVEPCVRSLLNQDYENLQVLVLDDGSTDGTGDILCKLARQDGRLYVLQGQPLPEGWLGKSWACHQLAQAAGGELLLFTDADTRHGPQTVRDMVSALIAEQADLLSAFPHQQVVSWTERLLVPIFQWGFMNFLPLALVYRWPASGMAAAIGQLMLFRRSAYEAIGGHAAVRQEVAEDIKLARLVQAHRRRWRLADGAMHVRCRMYHRPRDVVDGFSKNLFAVFGNRSVPFVFVWLWTWLAFEIPLLVWLAYAAGSMVSALSLTLAGIAIGESLLLWGLFYRRFRLPIYLTLLYPLTITLYTLLAFRSAVWTIGGHAQWKGRFLTKQAIRWF